MNFECGHMNKQHKKLAMAGIYVLRIGDAGFLHEFTDRAFTISE